MKYPPKLNITGLPQDLECLVGTYEHIGEKEGDSCYVLLKEKGDVSTEEYYLYFHADPAQKSAGGPERGRWCMGDSPGSEIG